MPRGNPTPVVSRSLTIPYDLAQKLSKYAKEKDMSVASVIVEAIRRLLKEEGVLTEEQPEQ